jgi:ribA/ribD-fused uncharacterized protein
MLIMSDLVFSDMSQVDEFAVIYVSQVLPFSNWSAHQIVAWGRLFSTVEHAYQYKKFIDIDLAWAERIRHAKSPYEAKRLGRQRAISLDAWHSEREEIMRGLLALKLTQHQDVHDALLETGDRAILEYSSSGDNFWGVGPDYSGMNTLGKIWMALREELQGQ